MDTYEATKTVLSRIQSLDPENASKITGYILIQDQGEKEMIRLAFSPESLLVSYVNQAKVCLGLSSNNCSTPSTPSSPLPFSNNNNNNPLSNSNRCNNPFSQTTPRIVIPTNTRFNLNNPSSPSSPWSARSSRSASYAAVVNGSTNTPSGSSSSSLSFPYFGNNTSDLNDEFANIQVQDQLPFLDESLDPIVSPSRRSDSLSYPYENFEENPSANHPHHQQFHRRSFSVNDAFLGGGEDGGNCGFGWRPCLYFARGFCKNGSTCKFLHSGGGFAAGDASPDGALVGSPGKIDGFDELLKLKALHQQRLAQQLLASGAPPIAFNKCATFLNESQRSAAAALAMGDEFLKLGRLRPDRSDFYAMGFGGNPNSASRQIYLTFPAESTFKEEDVSKYFSIYGPVQDVRIPYQQKRMFGFVTFLYTETVKLILAKGNPHFVCDSRVLVKPYKEKGKVPDKKQPLHLERGDFSGCLSPTGLESRDPFDLPFGSRIFYNAQEIMFRRKMKQEAELNQAIEFQSRRLMNMQLMDLKNHHPNQFQFQSHINNNNNPNLNGINSDLHEDTAVDNEQLPGSPDDNANGSNTEESDLLESFEDVLPENLLASPTKSMADMNSAFNSVSSADETPITSANYISMPSSLSLAAHNSCYFQMSRFSSGQEAAEI